MPFDQDFADWFDRYQKETPGGEAEPNREYPAPQERDYRQLQYAPQQPQWTPLEQPYASGYAPRTDYTWASPDQEWKTQTSTGEWLVNKAREIPGWLGGVKNWFDKQQMYPGGPTSEQFAGENQGRLEELNRAIDQVPVLGGAKALANEAVGGAFPAVYTLGRLRYGGEEGYQAVAQEAAQQKWTPQPSFQNVISAAETARGLYGKEVHPAVQIAASFVDPAWILGGEVVGAIKLVRVAKQADTVAAAMKATGEASQIARAEELTQLVKGAKKAEDVTGLVQTFRDGVMRDTMDGAARQAFYQKAIDDSLNPKKLSYGSMVDQISNRAEWALNKLKNGSATTEELTGALASMTNDTGRQFLLGRFGDVVSSPAGTDLQILIKGMNEEGLRKIAEQAMSNRLENKALLAEMARAAFNPPKASRFVRTLDKVQQTERGLMGLPFFGYNPKYLVDNFVNAVQKSALVGGTNVIKGAIGLEKRVDKWWGGAGMVAPKARQAITIAQSETAATKLGAEAKKATGWRNALKQGPFQVLANKNEKFFGLMNFQEDAVRIWNQFLPKILPKVEGMSPVGERVLKNIIPQYGPGQYDEMVNAVDKGFAMPASAHPPLQQLTSLKHEVGEQVAAIVEKARGDISKVASQFEAIKRDLYIQAKRSLGTPEMERVLNDVATKTGIKPKEQWAQMQQMMSEPGWYVGTSDVPGLRGTPLLSEAQQAKRLAKPPSVYKLDDVMAVANQKKIFTLVANEPAQIRGASLEGRLVRALNKTIDEKGLDYAKFTEPVTRAEKVAGKTKLRTTNNAAIKKELTDRAEDAVRILEQYTKTEKVTKAVSKGTTAESLRGTDTTKLTEEQIKSFKEYGEGFAARRADAEAINPYPKGSYGQLVWNSGANDARKLAAPKVVPEAEKNIAAMNKGIAEAKYKPVNPEYKPPALSPEEQAAQKAFEQKLGYVSPEVLNGVAPTMSVSQIDTMMADAISAELDNILAWMKANANAVAQATDREAALRYVQSQELRNALSTAASYAERAGVANRNRVMLDYTGNRYNAYTIMGRGVPFLFWFFEEGRTWLPWLMRNPSFAFGMYKYQQEMQQANAALPEQYRNLIPVDFPFNLGKGFANIQNLIPLNRQIQAIQSIIDPENNPLEASLGFMRPYPGMEWAGRQGLGALQKATGLGLDQYGKPRALGLPETTGRIGTQFPQTNVIQTATAKLKEAMPQTGLGKAIPAGGFNLENIPTYLKDLAGLKGKLPITAENPYDPTRVGRQIIQMQMNGEITDAQAKDAIYSQRGDIWDQALTRAYAARASSDIPGFLASIRFTQILPSELEIEEAKQAYAPIKAARDKGLDVTAQQRAFFDKYPLYGSWSDRYLTGEQRGAAQIKDAFYRMTALERRLARDVLGNEFESFMNAKGEAAKVTSNTDLLSLWATKLALVITPQEIQPAKFVQPIARAKPALSRAYDEYLAQLNEIEDEQTAYYKAKVEGKTVTASDKLRAYWEWSRKFWSSTTGTELAKLIGRAPQQEQAFQPRAYPGGGGGGGRGSFQRREYPSRERGHTVTVTAYSDFPMEVQIALNAYFRNKTPIPNEIIAKLMKIWRDRGGAAALGDFATWLNSLGKGKTAYVPRAASYRIAMKRVGAVKI